MILWIAANIMRRSETFLKKKKKKKKKKRKVYCNGMYFPEIK